MQYASHDYVEQLHAMGAQISMSAVGNPYDNAKAESSFAVDGTFCRAPDEQPQHDPTKGALIHFQKRRDRLLT